MIDIKVLRAMAAAGASIEVILLAIEEDQSRMETKRAKGREYTQRWRDKQPRNASKISRDLTKSHVRLRDITPPGIYTPPEVDKAKALSTSARKTALPEGFTLSAASFSFAEGKGWGSARIQSEFNRFCDHARANGRKQIDWEAAWRNWVTSPLQKPESMNGNHARTASDVLREMCEGFGGRESQDTGWLLPPDGRERS